MILPLKRYWEIALDYVFPKECFSCQLEGEYLCSACFDKIEFLDLHHCFLCHKITANIGICLVCSQKTGISKIIVATSYQAGLAGKLIEAYKFNYVQGLTNVLAEVVVQQIERQNFLAELKNKVFLPIPLHKKRLAERGFNQSEGLVKKLAPLYGCSLELKLLKRKQETAQQARLTRQERMVNVKEAFIVNKQKIAVPERIVLVDDVLTTGATFSAAARALKAVGVQEISCLAVCHG